MRLLSPAAPDALSDAAAGTAAGEDAAAQAREAERLSALARYAVMDTPPDPALDALVAAAAALCETPVSLVSLMDHRRHWFKARVGVDFTETPRELSFCTHLTLGVSEVPLVVEDATRDPRFAASPMVTGAPGVRFYAGEPLVAPGGHALGALCVIDTRPRRLLPHQREGLRHLGRAAMQLLEAHRERTEHARQLAEADATHLAALGAVLRTLEPHLETGSLLAEAAAGARELTRADGVAIHLVHGGQELLRSAGDGYPPGREPHAAVGLDTPLLLPDVGGVSAGLPAVVGVGSVASLAAVPLFVDGQACGVVEAVGGRPHQLGERDVWTLAMVAHGVGQAVSRLRALAEQDAAHAALRRSEERFRSAVNHSPIGMALVSPAGRVLEANRALCAMLGYGEAELRGLSVHQLTAPVDVEADVARMRETLAGVRASYQLEKRLFHKDGQMVWARLSVSLVRDAHGAPLHFITQIEDVTAQKRAAERLRQQAELLDAAQDAILVLELDGRVRYWNRAAEELYGYRSAAAVGQVGPLLLQTRFSSGSLGDVMEAVHGQGRWEGELVHTRADGREVLVHSRWSLQRDEDGRPVAILEVNRDVTARREALEALARQERQSRELFEALPDAVVVLRGRSFAYVNEAFAQFMGVPRQELIGKNPRDFLHPEDLPAAREASRAWRESGVLGPMREWRLRKPGGEEGVLELAIIGLRDFEGQPGMLAVGRDTTERKKMQQRLLLADRMASVGTLAAGVAHEINNPLAFLMGNLAYAGEELGDLLAAQPALQERLGETVEALREALDGAQRVKTIVKGLHTFSRADEELRAPLDVRAALETAVNMTANLVRHRARVVREYPEGLPRVVANEARLGQVFVNLLVNAAQSIPEGAAAENTVRLRLREAEGQVVVEVRDSGAGIAPAHLSRIFDPFFTTKPIGQGTGLGLSICHGIVTALGGKIEVESELGVGTTFRVLLPAAVERAAGGAGAGAPGPGGGGGGGAASARRRPKVWVVDDEAHIGALVRRVLADEADVEVLTSPHAALSRLAAGDRFEALVCDLLMPELGGEEVYAAIARDFPALAPHVTVMTGGAFTSRAQDFLSAFRGPVLAKPFSTDALRSAVRTALAGPVAPPPQVR